MAHRPPEQRPSLGRHLSVGSTLGALPGCGLAAAVALADAGPDLIVGVWAAAVALGTIAGAGVWVRARTRYRTEDR
ncbi:hypothetical protein DQ384_33950 [Sphaerisporangium album]|uniref:Uncharacterized protein n=1 Tax=Sphaerisporangium album TaxID=509200 RepID=A0A367EZ14_9ACTN|nr:hypothetical protein [Sphaerisporangium album]RCG23374.1 hypothetical protein DQ384_33950 [Sphaerisporangium album]